MKMDHPGRDEALEQESDPVEQGGDEPGRSLILRSEEDRGESLMSRIAMMYYRMAWRMPTHRLRISGKLPLRLLAVPVDPIEGDRAQGMAVRAGHFLFRGLKKSHDTIDFADLKLPPAFEDYVHRFNWLRDLDTAASREQAVPVAEKLVEQWLDANGTDIREPAWKPENCGWRFLIWASHAPLILSSPDLVYRSKLLNNLARTARHLDRTADKARSSLGRLVAWAGVLAASLLLPEGKARRIVGEDGFHKALLEFFGEDGGCASRSPLNQIEAIILLSMLRNVFDARSEELPPFIADALKMSVPPLTALTHHDGSLSSWQGSGAVSASDVAKVVEASAIRARPLREARQWGYQRVPAGNSVLIMDAAPPPIARMSVAGCASTLAFEFSHQNQPMIVNCGGAALVGATIPANLARGLRTTAAHSTLCIDDSNSTAIMPDGKLGRGITEVDFSRKDLENSTKIQAGHDGYARRYGLIHRRLILLRSDGLELRGEDLLLPDGKKRRKRKAPIPFAIRFHLHPDVDAESISEGKGVLLRLADGTYWQFRTSGEQAEIEDSVWIDGRDMPHPSRQIVIAGETEPGGGATGWLLKYMG